MTRGDLPTSGNLSAYWGPRTAEVARRNQPALASYHSPHTAAPHEVGSVQVGAQRARTPSITDADVKRFHALMRGAERDEDQEAPLHLFTKDAMWFHLGNAAVSTAQRWGLEVRLRLLDPRAFS